MTRLFVAVDLPSAVRCELVALQPPNAPGIRLVASAQIHITLHFIGDAQVEPIATALQAVALPQFSLSLEGVGHFESSRGDVTLWAGIRKSDALQNLHGEVGAALVAVGYRTEARPYTPHVTLARLRPNAPVGVVDQFLGQHARFTLPAVPVCNFGLFSSRTIDNAPVYRCERAFPLLADRHVV
jgi:2'-5' RNA ligase